MDDMAETVRFGALNAKPWYPCTVLSWGLRHRARGITISVLIKVF